MLSTFLLIVLILDGFSGALGQAVEETQPETKEDIIKFYNSKIKILRDLFLSTIKQLTKDMRFGETSIKEYHDKKLTDVTIDTENAQISVERYLEEHKDEGEDVTRCIKQNAEVLGRSEPSFASCAPKNIFWSTMRIIGTLKDKYIQVQTVLPNCLTMVGDSLGNLKQCLEYSITKMHSEFVDELSSKKDTVTDVKNCIDELVASIRNRNAEILDDVKFCENNDFSDEED